MGSWQRRSGAGEYCGVLDHALQGAQFGILLDRAVLNVGDRDIPHLIPLDASRQNDREGLSVELQPGAPSVLAVTDADMVAPARKLLSPPWSHSPTICSLYFVTNQAAESAPALGSVDPGLLPGGSPIAFPQASCVSLNVIWIGPLPR